MDEMSDEELERMAYDVIDCRPVSICMCGGEPLLRKESIYKIANYSKNTCVDVNMVTNGELMTKEIAKSFGSQEYLVYKLVQTVAQKKWWTGYETKKEHIKMQ